jgi:hypothetical protein
MYSLPKNPPVQYDANYESELLARAHEAGGSGFPEEKAYWIGLAQQHSTLENPKINLDNSINS